MKQAGHFLWSQNTLQDDSRLPLTQEISMDSFYEYKLGFDVQIAVMILDIYNLLNIFL